MGRNGIDHHYCVMENELEDLRERVDEWDGKIGVLLSEVKHVRESTRVVQEVAMKAVDKIEELAGEMRDRDRVYQAKCDLRHGDLDRKIVKIEEDDDPLYSKSGVNYTSEALLSRYNILSSDHKDLEGRYRDLENRFERVIETVGEEESKNQAIQRRIDEEVNKRMQAEAAARKALFKAFIGVLIAIATTITTLIPYFEKILESVSK